MIKPLPSQSELREHYDYNPETGELTYLQHYHSSKVGAVAGFYETVRGMTRASLRHNNIKYYRARLIYTWMTGTDPGELQVDHINRDSTDDRWDNLRLVTATVNCNNRKHNDNKYYRYVKKVRRNGKYTYYMVMYRAHSQPTVYSPTFTTPEDARDWARINVPNYPD